MCGNQKERVINSMSWMVAHFKNEQQELQKELSDTHMLVTPLYSTELQAAIDILEELKCETY